MQLDLLRGIVTTRADIQKVDTRRGKEFGQLDALLDVPGGTAGVLHPLRRGNAKEQGHALRDDGADSLDDGEEQAGAVFEAAAILVDALLGVGVSYFRFSQGEGRQMILTLEMGDKNSEIR